VEQNVDALLPLTADPLFDLQQHTYSHVLLKTICTVNERGTQVKRGGSLEQLDEELGRANAVILKQLGVHCNGITGPWNYYRGLADRPDILELLRKHGLTISRCWGRNEQDWQPVRLDLQPFWYEAQGFPEILEVGIHGWQDCIRREQVGWDNLDEYVRLMRRDLDEAAERDSVFSYCQHDWSSIRSDPTMRATRAILEYARQRGFRLLHYRQFYEERRAQQATAAREAVAV
jgi:peptidoglycan/xylan/chitin deacetylase (PgdA/CDA1 family)